MTMMAPPEKERINAKASDMTVDQPKVGKKESNMNQQQDYNE